MREQVLGQTVGNRTGMAAKNRSTSAPQRPVRRGRGSSGGSASNRLGALLRYVPLMLKFAIVIACGMLLFAGYRAAASARLFQLRNVEIHGTARASAEALQTIVRRDIAGRGVWQADLKEISADLQRVPWVRSAIVTRVLPDGIRVRISERVPCTVVRLSSGRFSWVDEDGVLLGEMQPTDEMPPFFLRGWNEDDQETAYSENRERVQKYLELRRLWEGTGLADRVSEVNLIDIRDVRAQLAGDDSQVEVRLGSQDLGKRLKQALNVLDEQKQTTRGPFISYVDLTQGKRAIVGFVSGAHTVTEASSLTRAEKASAKVAGSREASASQTTMAREKTKKREDRAREREKRNNSKRDGTR